MSLSHWVDAAHREAYVRAYAESLTLWPIPYTRAFVSTPCGDTHVVISGAASGEPLLLVHAASLSATQWHAQAAALGSRHRLFAVDIMGDIGCSTQRAPIHSRADAARWLAAVMDGLGLEQAICVGSSFGGFLCANLAAATPARVPALVLLAPAATFQPFALAAKLFIRLGGLVPLPFTVRPGLRAMMGGGLPDERLLIQMETGVAGFRYDPSGLFPSEIQDPELQRITCPSLVLIGANERIYDPQRAVARARRLLARVEASVLPGLGHLLSLQDVQQVNGHVQGFLERARPAVNALGGER